MKALIHEFRLLIAEKLLGLVLTIMPDSKEKSNFAEFLTKYKI